MTNCLFTPSSSPTLTIVVILQANLTVRFFQAVTPIDICFKSTRARAAVCYLEGEQHSLKLAMSWRNEWQCCLDRNFKNILSLRSRNRIYRSLGFLNQDQTIYEHFNDQTADQWALKKEGAGVFSTIIFGSPYSNFQLAYIGISISREKREIHLKDVVRQSRFKKSGILVFVIQRREMEKVIWDGEKWPLIIRHNEMILDNRIHSEILQHRYTYKSSINNTGSYKADKTYIFMILQYKLKGKPGSWVNIVNFPSKKFPHTIVEREFSKHV
jgi:hypothetical protein